MQLVGLSLANILLPGKNPIKVEVTKKVEVYPFSHNNEVEHGGLEDDFSLQGNFPLLWLWEEGYIFMAHLR